MARKAGGERPLGKKGRSKIVHGLIAYVENPVTSTKKATELISELIRMFQDKKISVCITEVAF